LRTDSAAANPAGRSSIAKSAVIADCTAPKPTRASIIPGSSASARSKKLLPLPQGVGRRGSVEAGHALKIEVHRVGIRHLFRASRLGGDELGVQRACQARDDFILHVEEIGQRLIEPLGSKVITRRLGSGPIKVLARGRIG
jgi:hypothetical protein